MGPDAPPNPGDGALKAEQPYSTRRRAILHALLAVTFAWGLRSPLQPQGYELLLFSVGLSVLATQFCMIDSRFAGKALPWSIQWLIYFTWPIYVPVYLVWSRGLRRLHVAGGYVVLFLAAYYVPAGIMWFILTRVSQE